MTNSIYAVASASSAGGLLLCLALMLWRKFQGQPVTDSLATPVMLLAEGLYQDDQCLLDNAATLLPIQSGAIAVLCVVISAIGATAADVAVLITVLYYCLALRCIKLRRDGSSNRLVYQIDHHHVLKFATPKALPSSLSSSPSDTVVSSACLLRIQSRSCYCAAPDLLQESRVWVTLSWGQCLCRPAKFNIISTSYRQYGHRVNGVCCLPESMSPADSFVLQNMRVLCDRIVVG